MIRPSTSSCPETSAAAGCRADFGADSARLPAHELLAIGGLKFSSTFVIDDYETTNGAVSVMRPSRKGGRAIS
jgi:hypothetical protein